MIKDKTVEYLNLKNLIDRSTVIDCFGEGKFLAIINIIKPGIQNIITKNKTFFRLSEAIDEIIKFKESNENILYFNSYVEDLNLKMTVYEIEEDYRERELDFNGSNIDIYQENSIDEKINNIITDIQNKTFNNLNIEINEEEERKELLEINKLLENIFEDKEEKILDTRNVFTESKYNNDPIEGFNLSNNRQSNNTMVEIGNTLIQHADGKVNITNDKQPIDIKTDIKETNHNNLNNSISFSDNRRNLNDSKKIGTLNNKLEKKKDNSNKKKYYILVMRRIEINTKEEKNINKKKINTSELCVVTDKLEQIHGIVKQQKEKMRQTVMKEKKSINSHVKIIEMPKNKTILENKKEFHSTQKTIESTKSSTNSITKNR